MSALLLHFKDNVLTNLFYDHRFGTVELISYTVLESNLGKSNNRKVC